MSFRPFKRRTFAKKPSKAGLAFAEQAQKPAARKPSGDRHTGDDSEPSGPLNFYDEDLTPGEPEK